MDASHFVGTEPPAADSKIDLSRLHAYLKATSKAARASFRLNASVAASPTRRTSSKPPAATT